MLNLLMLVMMAAMAVAGSVAGKRIALRITDRGTDVLYALTLIVVMLLCVRNFLVLLQAQRTLETAPGHAVPVQGQCPRAPNSREPHAQARGTSARPLVHALAPPLPKRYVQAAEIWV